MAHSKNASGVQLPEGDNYSPIPGPTPEQPGPYGRSGKGREVTSESHGGTGKVTPFGGRQGLDGVAKLAEQARETRKGISTNFITTA